MPQKILIVDDDLYLRELYGEILKDAGYDVETAINGEEGLTKLLSTSYNLALLDVMMPKLDGVGVLTKLKQTETYTLNTPIVILTNLSHDPILNQAKQLGATAYLIKEEMVPAELIEKIKPYIRP